MDSENIAVGLWLVCASTHTLWLLVNKSFQDWKVEGFFCLFVSHGSTFEVFWPDIATAWCYCTFWMSPEGILLPGEAQEPTQYSRNVSWSLFSLLPLGAAACHAAAAILVRSIIQWGQTEVNFMTWTQAGTECSGCCSWAVSGSETLGPLTSVQTDRQIH